MGRGIRFRSEGAMRFGGSVLDLARRPGGSSAWRTGLTGSPGALGRSDRVSRRAAFRAVRARRPGWLSCRSRSARWKHVRSRLKLQAQDVGKSALFRFDDGAGVIGDQPAEHFVGVLGIAQVPGAIECVPARDGEIGRVADVVQPRGGFQEIAVPAENRCQAARPRGNALDVRPAAAEGFLQECLGEMFGPGSQRVAGPRVLAPSACCGLVPDHNAERPSSAVNGKGVFRENWL